MNSNTTNKQSHLSFSNATLTQLRQHFTIQKALPKHEFDAWHAFKYQWKIGEQEKLEALIKKHKLYLRSYTEASLQIKFLSQIYSLVDFMQPSFQDFYHTYLKAEFPHIILSGYPDMMVATGDLLPEVPYFFLQEFKPSKPDKDPEYQVLAAMIAALQLNQTNELWGGYITSAIWNFMIVQKTGDKQYTYYVGDSLDSLSVTDLQQIFVMLQAVKEKSSRNNN